jgi:hypothetical protein
MFPKHFSIKIGCQPIDFKNGSPQLVRRIPSAGLFFDIDPTCCREPSHRIRERNSLMLHHERDGIAAFAAAETMESLFVGRNGKRGSFLGVKRAKPDKGFPSLSE